MGCGPRWSRPRDPGAHVSAPVRRRRDGRYVIRLDANTRAVLGDLALQVTATIDDRGPATRRLFPPAYLSVEMAEAEADYRSLVDTPLANHHRRSLEVLATTAEADTLSESEFHSWLDGIGTMRLMLGTRLDVTEDMETPGPDDPRAAEYGLYLFLSELQYLMVEVLAAELPAKGRPEDML